jgi:hypothetical protein
MRHTSRAVLKLLPFLACTSSIYGEAIDLSDVGCFQLMDISSSAIRVDFSSNQEKLNFKAQADINKEQAPSNKKVESNKGEANAAEMQQLLNDAAKKQKDARSHQEKSEQERRRQLEKQERDEWQRLQDNILESKEEAQLQAVIRLSLREAEESAERLRVEQDAEARRRRVDQSSGAAEEAGRPPMGQDAEALRQSEDEARRKAEEAAERLRVIHRNQLEREEQQKRSAALAEFKREAVDLRYQFWDDLQRKMRIRDDSAEVYNLWALHREKEATFCDEGSDEQRRLLRQAEEYREEARGIVIEDALRTLRKSSEEALRELSRIERERLRIAKEIEDKEFEAKVELLEEECKNFQHDSELYCLHKAKIFRFLAQRPVYDGGSSADHEHLAKIWDKRAKEAKKAEDAKKAEAEERRRKAEEAKIAEAAEIKRKLDEESTPLTPEQEEWYTKTCYLTLIKRAWSNMPKKEDVLAKAKILRLFDVKDDLMQSQEVIDIIQQANKKRIEKWSRHESSGNEEVKAKLNAVKEAYNYFLGLHNTKKLNQPQQQQQKKPEGAAPPKLGAGSPTPATVEANAKILGFEAKSLDQLTWEAVKNAFREKALLSHSDKLVGKTKEEIERLQAVFISVHSAFKYFNELYTKGQLKKE